MARDGQGYPRRRRDMMMMIYIYKFVCVCVNILMHIVTYTCDVSQSSNHTNTLGEDRWEVVDRKPPGVNNETPFVYRRELEGGRGLV